MTRELNAKKGTKLNKNNYCKINNKPYLISVKIKFSEEFPERFPVHGKYHKITKRNQNFKFLKRWHKIVRHRRIDMSALMLIK